MGQKFGILVLLSLKSVIHNKCNSFVPGKSKQYAHSTAVINTDHTFNSPTRLFWDLQIHWYFSLVLKPNASTTGQFSLQFRL